MSNPPNVDGSAAIVAKANAEKRRSMISQRISSWGLAKTHHKPSSSSVPSPLTSASTSTSTSAVTSATTSRSSVLTSSCPTSDVAQMCQDSSAPFEITKMQEKQPKKPSLWKSAVSRSTIKIKGKAKDEKKLRHNSMPAILSKGQGHPKTQTPTPPPTSLDNQVHTPAQETEQEVLGEVPLAMPSSKDKGKAKAMDIDDSYPADDDGAGGVTHESPGRLQAAAVPELAGQDNEDILSSPTNTADEKEEIRATGREEDVNRQVALTDNEDDALSSPWSVEVVEDPSPNDVEGTPSHTMPRNSTPIPTAMPLSASSSLSTSTSTLTNAHSPPYIKEGFVMKPSITETITFHSNPLSSSSTPQSSPLITSNPVSPQTLSSPLLPLPLSQTMPGSWTTSDDSQDRLVYPLDAADNDNYFAIPSAETQISFQGSLPELLSVSESEPESDDEDEADEGERGGDEENDNEYYVSMEALPSSSQSQSQTEASASGLPTELQYSRVDMNNAQGEEPVVPALSEEVTPYFGEAVERVPSRTSSLRTIERAPSSSTEERAQSSTPASPRWTPPIRHSTWPPPSRIASSSSQSQSSVQDPSLPHIPLNTSTTNTTNGQQQPQRAFPPPGTLVVVQGIVHTTEVPVNPTHNSSSTQSGSSTQPTPAPVAIATPVSPVADQPSPQLPPPATGVTAPSPSSSSALAAPVVPTTSSTPSPAALAVSRDVPAETVSPSGHSTSHNARLGSSLRNRFNALRRRMREERGSGSRSLSEVRSSPETQSQSQSQVDRSEAPRASPNPPEEGPTTAADVPPAVTETASPASNERSSEIGNQADAGAGSATNTAPTTGISQGSIDVLSTLLSVAAAATAASLLTTSAEQIYSNSLTNASASTNSNISNSGNNSGNNNNGNPIPGLNFNANRNRADGTHPAFPSSTGTRDVIAVPTPASLFSPPPPSSSSSAMGSSSGRRRGATTGALPPIVRPLAETLAPPRTTTATRAVDPSPAPSTSTDIAPVIERPTSSTPTAGLAGGNVASARAPGTSGRQNSVRHIFDGLWERMGLRHGQGREISASAPAVSSSQVAPAAPLPSSTTPVGNDARQDVTTPTTSSQSASSPTPAQASPSTLDTTTSGSGSDPREALFHELARAFRMGLDRFHPHGNNHPTNHDGGSSTNNNVNSSFSSSSGSEPVTPANATVPLNGGFPGTSASVNPTSPLAFGTPTGSGAGGSPLANLNTLSWLALGASGGLGSQRALPAEGTFERFLLELHSELRNALGHESQQNRNGSGDTGGPTQPQQPPQQVASDSAPAQPVRSGQQVASPASPNNNRINWWRSYQFPVVQANVRLPGSGTNASATTTVPPAPRGEAPPGNAQPSTSATASTPATSNNSTNGASPTTLVPVILVGLQSINMGGRPGLHDDADDALDEDMEEALNEWEAGLDREDRPTDGDDVFGAGGSSSTLGPDLLGSGRPASRQRMGESDPWDSGLFADQNESDTLGERERERGSGWRSRLRNMGRGRRAGGDHNHGGVGLAAEASGGAPVRPQHQNQAVGSRTFLIYVIGGYYPPDHSIITGGVNQLDAFGALLEIAEMFANQYKPPTASKEEIEKSGLEVIKPSMIKEYEEAGRMAANCVDQCLICLDEYQPEDDVRVMACRHAYHKGCVDKWLETGRNNCPACRSKGVDTGSSSASSS